MKTAKLIDKLQLPPPGHYVVAVSGGVDSVVLLHLLALSPDYRLRVAHYDHGWRADSHRDAKLVAGLASIHGLPFHSLRAAQPDSSEAAARQSRYAFLQTLVKTYQADGVITAHHLDDRQETSLFNLLRGGGPAGAASLNSRSRLWRPLLAVRKSQLYDYARHHGLPWREDSTNSDITITRNFLRHELLPAARAADPDFDQRYHDDLRQLSGLSARLDQDLNRLLTPAYDATRRRVVFDRQLLGSLSLPALQQLLWQAARLLSPGLQWTSSGLQELARQIKSLPSGSQWALPGRLKLTLGYDKVAITFDNQDGGRFTYDPVELPPQTSLLFGHLLVSYGDLPQSQVRIEPQPLLIRRSHPGDRVAPVGMTGHKKLSDLFVDAKVPRALRADYPVLAAYNGEVVWVPGLAFSRQFLPDSSRPTHGLDYQQL